MTRDEVRIRSEGTLEAAELALTRTENVLRARDWVAQVRAQTVMPERIDDAVARVRRIDAHIGGMLEARRDFLADLTRRRLRELGIAPTATRLDDLIAQLIARAQLAEPLRISVSVKRPRLNGWQLAAGACFAMSLIGIVTEWNSSPSLLLAFGGVFFLAAVLRQR